MMEQYSKSVTLLLIYVNMKINKIKCKFNKTINIYVLNVYQIQEICCFCHVNIQRLVNIVAIKLRNVLYVTMKYKKK
jgi:hypothetical protein